MLDRLAPDPAIPYDSGFEYGRDGAINHLGDGRGVYARVPGGHRYELFTAESS